MKIIHVAGARPNFMKLAPILRETGQHPDIHNILLHTGQHYDARMSDVFFDDLALPRPDINLQVGSASHAEQTAQIMLRFEPVLLAENPDLVLVVGDVNSTLACSLVAAKLGIPVAHVEAGVRSFDRGMPEEINRVVTDSLSDLLLTPSLNANQNLLKQGIDTEKIHFVGNVMVDSLLHALQVARPRQSWTRWGFEPGGYAVLTLHRASNVDDLPTLTGLMETIIAISHRLPVIFPVHPRTANRLQSSPLAAALHASPGLILTEPLGYLDFLCLQGDARFILTDSGGIQSEATILGVPCLTLRWNTEWPETIEQGTNRLVGTQPDKIFHAVDEIFSSQASLPQVPQGWDGQAASRIAAVIRHTFYLD
jgi:UDP-N-acetylglucosamine 2-epimerase (non-hydrolysing)